MAEILNSIKVVDVPTTKSSVVDVDDGQNAYNLTFKNLEFQIISKSNTFNCFESSQSRKPQIKQILYPCSGSFQGGEMVAIMGPSGSGKSTLLDILASQKTLPYSGQVLVNGRSIRKCSSDLISYISQGDVHHPLLTVRETLTFASEMTFASESAEKHSDRVEMLMMALGLSSVADTLVGSEMKRGISGGQSRRLMVARGIIRSPSILFLDEPTSGLSSTDAENLVDKLKIYIKQKKALGIAVIHQPRPSVLEKFDKILLMCQGRLVFQGSQIEMISFMSSIGRELPLHENPADFVLDVLTEGHHLDACSKAIEYSNNLQSIKYDNSTELNDNNISDSALKVSPSNLTKLKLMIDRAFKTVIRDKQTLTIQIVSCILQVLMVGLVFFDKDNAETRPNIILLLLLTVGFSSFDAIPFLIEERQRFLSEKNAGFYTAGLFYSTLSLQHGTVSLIKVVIAVSIGYFMTGLSASGYFSSLTLFYLTSFVIDSIVHLISCSSDSLTSATALTGLLLTLLSLFNGALVNTKTIAGFLTWALYISPFYYLFEALMIVLYPVYDDASKSENVLIMEQYGLDPNALFRDIIVIVGISILAKLSTWIVLMNFVKQVK